MANHDEETRRRERDRRRPRAPQWLLIGVVAALVLGACSSSGTATSSVTTDSNGTPTTTGTSNGAPVPTGAGPRSGCGTAAAAGSITLTPTIGGRRRTVIVHVPVGYTGAAKVPLVLNMHGSGSTALDQELFTAMNSTADAHGFIVAYPQALIPDGSGFDWNVPVVPLIGDRPVPAGSADDVTFLVQLVSLLERDYCVDPARVYATGFSGGARTASQLACDASTVFAAVAPVSGLRRPTPCPTARPVPVVAFHGTADPIDPYGGHGEGYWTYSVLQAAQRWASQDGCSPAAATSTPDPGVRLTEYAGCSGGASVELYSIIGEGHEWPGGPHLRRRLTKVLGPQSNAIDADNIMWAFFVAHPMP